MSSVSISNPRVFEQEDSGVEGYFIPRKMAVDLPAMRSKARRKHFRLGLCTGPTFRPEVLVDDGYPHSQVGQDTYSFLPGNRRGAQLWVGVVLVR